MLPHMLSSKKMPANIGKSIGKGGDHPTVVMPLVPNEEILHQDNCCVGDVSRRYTRVGPSRLETNRPVPLWCGVPCPGCPGMCYKPFAGMCGGYVDQVYVMYWDDAFMASNPCCPGTFVPQSQSCFQCICNKLTCGGCCNIDRVERACCPICW
jgi:hypothetical protein